MYKALLKASQWLGTYTSYFIIAIAVMTFFAPDLFAWVKGNVQSCILGFIMLTMGLTLTMQDMRILASRPLDILIGTCAQFSLMPLIAWMLTVGVGYFGIEVPKPIIVGIILVGCCPGGVSSNIMSYLCKGDVAFSVGMTTASTLLAPIVTPLLVLFLAGEKVEVDAWGMFCNIMIVTLLPVTVGFVSNLFWGKNESFKKAQSVMPAFSVLGLACIVGGVVAAVHDKLLMQGVTFFFLVFVVVLCHNTLGYFFGYTVGRIFHFSKAKNRTVSIEVGMQNAGLATVLSSTFFAASCPLAVIPCAVSCAWHSISGTILASWFAARDRR
ncbi:MAG: bile acid:sodium symporter family protein [Prevotella sp.]|nr:bile acid:sodium symporter family protein [Prevotella sp.]MCI7269757.1 bile acid:sodium symporter family protein [Prevotella sp.]MCI7496680.1 bile acid:sodium symporter family protein [Prevotella sp.]MDD7508226.1 bile acid:sodium symporter family protein [Prevotella sp.]MDY4751361.1 bile acid:sodium symporter family protein [Prevotella sp.]